MKKISLILLIFLLPNCAAALSLTNRPVVTLQNDRGGRCSAVVLNKHMVMTARHCLPDKITDKSRVSLDNTHYFSKYKVIYNDKPEKSSARLNDGVVILKLDIATGINVFADYPKIGTHREKPYHVYCFPVHFWTRKQQLYSKLVSFGFVYNEGNRKYIATNISVSGGCSGGGLFNKDGDLIGITHSGHGRAVRAGYFLDLVDYRQDILKVLP